MSTHRHIDAICVAVLILTLLITVLFMNGEALGIRVIVDEDAEEHGGEQWFTANDRNGAWDTGGATVIKLNGSCDLLSQNIHSIFAVSTFNTDYSFAKEER